MIRYSKSCVFHTALPRSKRLREMGVSGVQVINRGVGDGNGGGSGDVTRSQIIDALGYTPYDSANPAKYGKVNRIKINGAYALPDNNGDVNIGNLGGYSVMDEEPLALVTTLMGAQSPTISEYVFDGSVAGCSFALPATHAEGVLHKTIVRNESNDLEAVITWPFGAGVFHPMGMETFIPPRMGSIFEHFWSNGHLYITELSFGIE